MRGVVFVLVASLFLLIASHGECVAGAAQPRRFHVFIGTNVGPQKGGGIYHAILDTATGTLSDAELVAKAESPSFLAIHPNGRWLYVVTREANQKGGVVGFEIAEDGKLTQLGSSATTPAGPCHLTVDPSAKCVLVACYSSGCVTAHPLAKDGSVQESACVIQHKASEVTEGKQTPPHAHYVQVDPQNGIVFVADAGLDKIMRYRLDPDHAQLTPHHPPFVPTSVGSGPRHLAFHPNRKSVYVNGETTGVAIAFSYDAKTGNFSELQELSTLPETFKGKNTTAQIEVHPNGRFLYVSNRGDDSLAIFEIAADGKLKALGHHPSGGKTPRNFAIDPTGAFLLSANQGSNNIVLMKVDPATGKLATTDRQIEVVAPVCIKYLPISEAK
jgi:6-phosphogluconolactonase